MRCAAATRLLLLSIYLPLFPVATAAGQDKAPSYPPKQCAPGPVGRLTGIGEVFYRLLPDRRPDTSSIIVLRVRGISAAGYRSAVARSIPRCRFDIKVSNANRPALVQFVAFDSTGYKVAPAVLAADTAPAGISLEPPVVSGVFDETDPMLEERPYHDVCKPPRRSEGPRTITFSSREEADRYFEEQARRMSGSARFSVVVQPDGTVDPSSVEVLSSTNPTATPELLELALSCRYYPGRIGGVAVPVRIVHGTGMEIRTSP